MSLRFRGGEHLQRGRGIGGLLRLAKSVFSPLMKTAGKTIVRAAKSNTGRMIGNAIRDQAITSGVNLLGDAIRGNDMGESLHNELGNMRQNAGDLIENIVKQPKRKRYAIRKKKKQGGKCTKTDFLSD
jgi:hypothetical protein